MKLQSNSESPTNMDDFLDSVAGDLNAIHAKAVAEGGSYDEVVESSKAAFAKAFEENPEAAEILRREIFNDRFDVKRLFAKN